MKIDREKIKAAFPGKAWVYAEGYDAITITYWTGDSFARAPGEAYLTLLRVFDSRRELLFSGGKCRDTADYGDGDVIQELADTAYLMYGEQAEVKDGLTLLREARGGALVFPAELSFPQTASLPGGVIGLKLGIKHFVRCHPVAVLPKGKAYDFGLNRGGRGAIEVVDYAYTGFFYADGKPVAL